MESESALFKTAIFKTVSFKADVFKVITFYTLGSPCHFYLTESKEEKIFNYDGIFGIPGNESVWIKCLSKTLASRFSTNKFDLCFFSTLYLVVNTSLSYLWGLINCLVRDLCCTDSEYSRLKKKKKKFHKL